MALNRRKFKSNVAKLTPMKDLFSLSREWTKPGVLNIFVVVAHFSNFL